MEPFLVFGTYFLLCIGYIQRSDEAQLNRDLEDKKRIVRQLAILMLLLGALRNRNTGIDTINYVKSFTRWRANIPLSQLWKEAISSFDSEQAYYILENIFRSVLPNAQLWMTFQCIIFVVPCAILIYRYSDCPPVSFIYPVSIFLYTFTWQGLRQNVAISICLFAFLALTQRRPLLYILLILLAFQFHRTAIVFFLAIPAMIMSVNLFSFLWIGVFFVITLITPESVNQVLLSYFNYFDKVQVYAGGNASQYTYTMFFILLLLYIACYLLKDELIEENPINAMLFNLSMFGIIMQALASVIAEFFRMSYYFNVFNMLLTANAGYLAWRKYPRMLFRIGLVVFLVVLFFAAGGFDYWFFWENPWFTTIE